MPSLQTDRAVKNESVSAPAASFYGWKLIVALWLIYFLNMGFPLYGGAVINTYMLKQIPMPRSIYGLGFTLLNFFIGVPSVLVAASIVKWGARRTFEIGSSLIFLGSLWMAFLATQSWQYLVGFGVLIGSGIGFGTIVPVSTAVTRWFARYRGRAMAIAFTASGFAGIAGAPLMNKVLAATGGRWQLAWEVVAGISLLAGVISHCTVKERPEDLGQVVDGNILDATHTESRNGSGLVTQEHWTPREAYKTAAFWLIVLGSVACQYPFFFFTAHWMLDLQGLGIKASDAALAMGLFTMGGIVGRLIGGIIIDKLAARYAFMIGICFCIVGSFLAMRITSTSLTIAFAAAILYGAAFGWTFVCLNTITGNYYGSKAFPKVSGAMLLFSALLCCPAALIGGKLFDLYKSYNPAFQLNIVLCLMGILALAFAQLPKRSACAALGRP